MCGDALWQSIQEMFRLFAYQENGWDFSEVGQSRLFPFADAPGADKFLFRGQPSSHTEACPRIAGAADVGKELGVSVGRFDK